MLAYKQSILLIEINICDCVSNFRCRYSKIQSLQPEDSVNSQAPFEWSNTWSSLILGTPASACHSQRLTFTVA